MKRSEALRALSHQHHQGLFAALQLKRAGRETAAEARQVFLDFYEREGSRHFRAEEELLLPAFARHTARRRPGDRARSDRARRPASSRAGPGARARIPIPPTLRELGERLESHIRFEERVLFPMIEEALPVDELERLGAAFARAEAEHE